MPAPDTARAVLARLGPVHGDLLDTLAAELGPLGAAHTAEAWDLSWLPAHLRIAFRVVHLRRALAADNDLAGLSAASAPSAGGPRRGGGGITRSGLRSWDLGTLPGRRPPGQVRA